MFWSSSLISVDFRSRSSIKPVLARVILIKIKNKTLSTERTLHGSAMGSGEPQRMAQRYRWKRKGNGKWRRKLRSSSEAAERWE